MPRFVRPPESWPRKFRLAGRGILFAVRKQSSFWVHLPIALLVLAGATVHQVSQLEWAILILCITIVLAAEAFNTAIEHLARATTEDENQDVRHALDVASGAVLITAIGAAIVGSLILISHLVADIQQYLGSA